MTETASETPTRSCGCPGVQNMLRFIVELAIQRPSIKNTSETFVVSISMDCRGLPVALRCVDRLKHGHARKWSDP